MYANECAHNVRSIFWCSIFSILLPFSYIDIWLVAFYLYSIFGGFEYAALFALKPVPCYLWLHYFRIGLWVRLGFISRSDIIFICCRLCVCVCLCHQTGQNYFRNIRAPHQKNRVYTRTTHFGNLTWLHLSNSIYPISSHGFTFLTDQTLPTPIKLKSVRFQR